MDALMEALNTDTTARPSAAEFRDRLAAVPGPGMRKGRPPLTVGRPVLSVLPERRVLAAAASGDLPPAAPPRIRHRRRVGILATAAALVLLATSSAAWLIAEPASSGAPPAATIQSGQSAARVSPTADPGTPEPTPTPRTTAGSDPVLETIQVEGSGVTAEPFETVPIRGTYRGGAQRFLQVQWRVNGSWQAFPVPAKTDESGQFTAYVEMSRPNDYRLRVRDPQSGVTSDSFTLLVKDAADA